MEVQNLVKKNQKNMKLSLEVQLIYIVVLVSGVVQSDSVLYIYTYMYICSDYFPTFQNSETFQM